MALTDLPQTQLRIAVERGVLCRGKESGVTFAGLKLWLGTADV